MKKSEAICRVRWTKTVTTTGYVRDGGQDCDVWEGRRGNALKLARELRQRGNPRYTYSVVPSPDLRPRKDPPP